MIWTNFAPIFKLNHSGVLLVDNIGFICVNNKFLGLLIQEFGFKPKPILTKLCWFFDNRSVWMLDYGSLHDFK
jgi:hypothetical protein